MNNEMILVKTKTELRKQLTELGVERTVGFVPTMGALHRGHISLVEKAMAETEVVVVSIFVNPTQFNDPEDLKRYPRTLEADLKLLEPTGCHLVFAPAPEEIYPEPDTRQFDFGELESVMEGEHRPGHFNGVAQVVSKLFEIVGPDKAYFGMKDFQQLAIIRQMVIQMRFPVEIVPCPTMREESGLAMSSRNELLSAEERQNAAVIARTLLEARSLAGDKPVDEVRDWIQAQINNNPYLEVEYVEIVNDKNLQPVKSWNDNWDTVVCVAVYCGKVRLIDNMVLN